MLCSRWTKLNSVFTTQRANAGITYCHVFALDAWLYISSVSPNNVGKVYNLRETKMMLVHDSCRLLRIHKIHLETRKIPNSGSFQHDSCVFTQRGLCMFSLACRPLVTAPRAKGRKRVRSLNQHKWVLTT